MMPGHPSGHMEACMLRSRPAPLALAAAVAVAVASLAGCSKPAADAASPATGTADAAASAAPAASDPAPRQTDTAASGFVLDMSRVDAYYATIGKISAMYQADPSLALGKDGEEDDPVAMDASESIDEYVARIEADPKAKRLVTSAGMSVSDFAHTNAALLEGMMAAGMMEATGKTDVPEGINPQFVAFARQHKAELQAKLSALQAQAGAEE
jgi:hypothetical protein